MFHHIYLYKNLYVDGPYCFRHYKVKMYNMVGYFLHACVLKCSNFQDRGNKHVLCLNTRGLGCLYCNYRSHRDYCLLPCFSYYSKKNLKISLLWHCLNNTRLIHQNIPSNCLCAKSLNEAFQQETRVIKANVHNLDHDYVYLC